MIARAFSPPPTRQRMARRRAVLAGALCLGLGGLPACADPSSDWPSEGIYDGYYFGGFEQSEFRPVGSRGVRWWLNGDLSAVNERFHIHLDGRFEREHPPVSPVRIRVQGQLSRPGQYGHMSAYSRELTVTRVLQAEAPAPNEPIPPARP